MFLLLVLFFFLHAKCKSEWCSLLNLKYNRPWHPHLMLPSQAINFLLINFFVNMSFLVGNGKWSLVIFSTRKPWDNFYTQVWVVQAINMEGKTVAAVTGLFFPPTKARSPCFNVKNHTHRSAITILYVLYTAKQHVFDWKTRIINKLTIDSSVNV